MKQEKENKSREESTDIHLTGDSTLQTPEEDRRDSANDPVKNDRMEPSNDDLHETGADRMAGSDRAGTAERKDQSLDTSAED